MLMKYESRVIATLKLKKYLRKYTYLKGIPHLPNHSHSYYGLED